MFTINGRGGHPGHVAWTNYVNFYSPSTRSMHIKFGLIIQAVIEKKTFEYNGHIHVYHVYISRPESDNPMRSIGSFAASFSP